MKCRDAHGWFVVMAASLLPCGCGEKGGPSARPGSVVVEREGDREDMTPALRDRRYRSAYDKGVELAKNEQYGLALGAFEEAARLKPDSTDALFNMGACHEAIGDPLRAIHIYRRVLELCPGDADCYANIGTSYIKLYYRERSPAWRSMARQAWRKSLELRPDQPDVRQFLARSESGE